MELNGVATSNGGIMYKAFHIKNFRGFEDFQINNLASINLIGGKNNVGKTGLLEAILLHAGRHDVIFSRLNHSINLFDRYPPNIRRIDFPAEFITWDFLFYLFDENQTIEIYADHTWPNAAQLALFDKQENALPLNTLQISVVDPLDVSEEPMRYLTRNLRRIRSVRSIETDSEMNVLRFDYGYIQQYYGVSEGRISLDRYSQPRLNANFLPARETTNLREMSERFSDLKRAKATDFLVDILKIIEPRLLDLDLLANGIHADIGMQKLIPLSAVGDGMVRLANLILAISSSENGIICIDEIENGLHYTILEDVWRVIDETARRFNVQIFATTHDLEIIRAAQVFFAAKEDSPFRYHRLDRDTTAEKITANSYPPDLLAYAMENAYEVRG